jgi:hypothetical protein
MNNVVQFKPKPRVIKGYRMSFYEEIEIDIALICVNTFGFDEIGYTRKTLKQLDPLYIKRCLIEGYNSDLISKNGRDVINKIIDSIEEIAIAVN